MKRLILLVLAYILSLSHANAQYQIRIKTASIKDTTAFFRGVVFDDKNYLAKDTVNLSKGTAVIKWKKPIIGGIYYFYFPISKQKVYFILENKDSLNFEFKGDHLLDSVITNKQKNINFIKYQLLETSLSSYDSLLAHEIAKGKKN